MESFDLSGTKRVYEGNSGNSNNAIQKTRLFENLEDLEEELVSKLNIDLNAPFKEEDNVAGNSNQIVHRLDLNGPFNKDIKISFEDDDKMLQKGIECTLDVDLHLGMNNEGCGERRYSKKENGKTKVDDEILSLRLPYESERWDMIYNAKGKAKADDGVSSSSPTYNFQHFDIINETLELDAVEVMESMAAMIIMPRDLVISEDKERGSTSMTENFGDYPHITSTNDYLYEYKDGMIFDERLEFSGELMGIIDRDTKEKGEQLIDWSPRQVDFSPHAPSLLDLSFDVLCKNPDSIFSFEHVPEWIKRKFVNFLCDTRKLDTRILELLFQGSPSEICVKNCSWTTENVLVDMWGKSNMQKLRVLQLDYCRQSFTHIIPESLVRDTNSLPCLTILSLEGAARLCDYTLKLLLASAPLLQSINLSQCTLLTHDANLIAYYLKTNLKELHIDNCPGINVMRCLSSMVTFEHLEVLSVEGSDTVCDEFVMVITETCGAKLKGLNLASCVRLTNRCLQAIGKFCPALCALDISSLCKITDLGLCSLAEGCKLLELLNVAHDDFSDEIVAAFLETSGRSLRVLSLDHVVKVSFNSAFAVAKYSTDLVCLDLSGCHQLTDEALGFITDNCSSLKVLNIFGCTQLTERFLFGHGNSQLQIVG